MTTLQVDWNNARRTIKRKYEELRDTDEYRYAHYSHAASAAIDWYSRQECPRHPHARGGVGRRPPVYRGTSLKTEGQA